MTPVEALVARAARRRESAPSLDAALLVGDGPRYALSRMRFAGLRAPLRVGLHLAEVVLLASLFPPRDLGPFLAVRAALGLASALSHGALEPLRVEIRGHLRRRELPRARAALAAGVASARLASLVPIGCAGLWVLLGPRPVPGLSIYDAFALAAGLRVAVEHRARGHAAGVSAVRGVPRPLSLVVAADVVDSLGAVALWPWLGPWGFAVALLTGGLFRAGIQGALARRAYRASRLGPPGPGRSALRLPAARAALVAGLAGGTSQLDALLFVALVAGTRGSDGSLVALLHVTRPLLAASVGMMRSFGRDLSRHAGSPPLLADRLDRLLLGTALGTALVTAALSFLLGAALDLHLPAATVAALVVLLAARSVLIVRQVQAFAMGRYRELLAGGAVVVVPLLVVLGDRVLRAHAPAVLALGFTGIALWLRPPRSTGRAPSPVPPLHEFLAARRRDGGASRVVAVELDPRCRLPPLRVARALAGTLGRSVTQVTPRRLLWVEPCDAPSGRVAIARAGAGVLSRIDEAPAAENEVAAVEAAAAAGLLGERLQRALAAPVLPGPGDLSAAFRAAFPDGTLLDARRGALASAGAAGAIDRGRLRAARDEIFRLARTPLGRPPRGLPVRVAVYAPGGSPQLVFAVPAPQAGEEFARFAERVEAATLRGSLGAES